MTSISLASLGDSESLHICLFLGPSDACRLQVTNRRGELQIKAGSDELWTVLGLRRFNIRGSKILPGDCDEQPTSLSWRNIFARWAQTARRLGVGVDAPAEWIDVWRRLRAWLSVNADHVNQTLKPSAAQEAFDSLTHSGFRVSPLVAGMWRVFDGQNARVDPGLANELGLPKLRQDGQNDDRWANGLFGGYSVYDHEVSVILLPIRSALKLTQFLQQKIQPLYEHHRTKLAFACSHNYSKIMLVDVEDGQVYVWTRRTKPILEAACPADGTGKGLLNWVAEFATRLEKGCFVSNALRPECQQSIGISLLPAIEPLLTRCITQGVEITASVTYMPEHPQGWTYRLSFGLVGDAASRGYETCQLDVRHWEICTDGQEPQHVHGDGVIGFFPILVDGGWLLNRESDPHGQYAAKQGFQAGSFSYQSCSGRSSSMRGIFGGDVTFIPGTKKKRTGKPFQARVEPFRLQVPDYIY